MLASQNSKAAVEKESDARCTIILENLPPWYSDQSLKKIVSHGNFKGKAITQLVTITPGPNSKEHTIGKPTATDAKKEDWAKQTPMAARFNFEFAEDANAAVKLWDNLDVDGFNINAWLLAEHPNRRIPFFAGVISSIPQPASGTEVDKTSASRPQTNSSAATPRGTNAGTQAGLTASQINTTMIKPRRAGGGTSTASLSIHGTGRYPFAPMQISWLVSYVNALRNPERSFTMCRVLECLMNNAIATGDPYMEFAVVNFYTKFNVTAWGKAQALMTNGVGFELCRQVFEVLGLVRKYAGANSKSRKMLLSLVERLLEDIQNVSNATKVLNTNKAIPEVILSIIKHLEQLRSEEDNEDALQNLLSWLKFLFYCLSTHQHQNPQLPESSNTIHCNEECECFKRTKTRFTNFINDVEKAKIIDCLAITALLDGDDYVANLVDDLLTRYPPAFCDRAIKGLHNSVYTLMRFKLFVATRLSKRINTVNRSVGRRYYDTIEGTLLLVKEHVLKHITLKTIVSLIDAALICIYQLRDVHDITTASTQQLYTLQFNLGQIFMSISTQHYLLAVHSDTPNKYVDVGPAAELAQLRREKFGIEDGYGMIQEDKGPQTAASQNAAVNLLNTTNPVHCANPTCSGNSAELLKCSGCKVNYYCSVDCQKLDWKAHRTMCKDLSLRKSAIGGAAITPGMGGFQSMASLRSQLTQQNNVNVISFSAAETENRKDGLVGTDIGASDGIYREKHIMRPVFLQNMRLKC